jgi:Protein of unknown function (DUF3309)
MGLLILVILVLLLMGVVPVWPHSQGFGYGPSGCLGVMIIVVIALMVLSVL